MYQRDKENEKARQCPHCFSKIDANVWAKEILPAFGKTQEANADLLKEHVTHGKPLFTFDIIADHLYKNRETGGKACPLVDALCDIMQQA